MRAPLTPEDFETQLRTFRHTAFRLELQRAYRESGEPEAVEQFLAGDRRLPTEMDGLRAWYAQVTQQTHEGKRIERVRVHDDPPTDYQRWERWADRWNTEAGEAVRYLTRNQAHEIGLLPGAGVTDWWLLDSNRLVLMTFDEIGNRIRNELETDPATVVRACAWRDLAVHFSAPSPTRSAAA